MTGLRAFDDVIAITCPGISFEENDGACVITSS